MVELVLKTEQIRLKIEQIRLSCRLMFVLALVDTGFLVSSILTFSLPQLSRDYSSSLWNYMVPYTLPLAQTCLTASVYMTISLSLERYFSVVHPLYQLSNRLSNNHRHK